MRDKTKRIVWRCINRLEHGKTFCKELSTLEEKALHEAILSSIQKQLGGQDGREILSQSIQEHLGGQIREQYMLIDYRIKQLQDKRRKLIDECSSDTLTKYMDIFKAISDEMKGLENRRREIESIYVNERNENAQLKRCLNYIENFDTPMEYDEVIVRQLIEKIRVDSKEPITIFYKDGVADRVSLRMKKRMKNLFSRKRTPYAIILIRL